MIIENDWWTHGSLQPVFLCINLKFNKQILTKIMSLEDFLFKKFYKFYTKEFHYEKLFIIQMTLSLPAVFYLYMNILMYFFIINI